MPEKKEMTAPQKAIVKMGLTRDIDLALHLPLRYEDTPKPASPGCKMRTKRKWCRSRPRWCAASRSTSRANSWW